MAQYTVQHTCGHEASYRLFGKTTERDRKLAWLSTQECPNCRRAAEEAAAAQRAEELRLPALEGSPKQVAWAMGIRDQAVLAVSNLYRSKNLPVAEAWEKTGMRDAIASETSARYWIDHRDMQPLELARQMKRALGTQA